MRGIRLFFIAVLAGLMLFSPVLSSPLHADQLEMTTATVAGVTCTIVSIPMEGRRYRVDVEVAHNFPGTDESFEEFVKRLNPIAAVNGTFFGKNRLLPIGDIVKDGKLLHFGGMGTAICMTKNNRIEFVDVDIWKHMDWSRYLTVLAAGPRLVTAGRITVDPKSQGFTDPRVLGKANRVLFGLTADNRLLIVTVAKGISLDQCARIMLELGSVDAMNNDGGASQALYFKGEYKIKAGRRLTNVLYVKEYESDADPLSGIGGGVGAGKSADAYYSEGLSHLSAGRLKDAIDSLKTSTTLDPNQAAYYNALADAYGLAGDDRSKAFALRQAGKIYLTKGLHDTAINKLEEARGIVTDDPETYRLLGLVYEGVGKHQMAARMYKLSEKYAFAASGTSDAEMLSTKGITLEEKPPPRGGGESFVPQPPEDEVPEKDERPFDEFEGELSGRSYTERNVGFSIDWPEGWDATIDEGEMTIILAHESGPFYGTLQAFWVAGDETLDSFEEKYIGGSYKSEIARYNTEIDDYPALRTLYEEIIKERSTGQQYFYVKKGRWIVVLSFMTYAENYHEGGPMFAEIVESIKII